ncbi:MAG: hypothetical protein KDA60_13215 [Planctomycetales bacterium]|nr:hypothetical protein [Planctomycetales bacterium]
MSDFRLNIHEAKTHLSRYLNELGSEDRIVLCRRNQPVAEIRLLPPARREPRQLGLAKGDFKVDPSFFEPLPEAVLDAFEGKS